MIPNEGAPNAMTSIMDRMSAIQARFGAMSGTARGTLGTGTSSRGAAFDQVMSNWTSTTTDSPSTGKAVDGNSVVSAASKYLGTPYVWGGESLDEGGLDCSGFVQKTFSDLGIDLPRVSRDQAKAGSPVASLAEARPGDLVAFGEPVDHIGIYAGNNTMIVAPHTGDVVKFQQITKTPTAIRRITDSAGTAPTSSPYESLFASAASKYGIPASLLRSVANAESSMNPNAVSRAGAQGLMQLMPSTAAGLGVDPFDPAQAVDGAARILSQNLQQFGSVPLAVAAYNAGAGAVQRAGGIPDIAETRDYVRKVMDGMSSSAINGVATLSGFGGATSGTLTSTAAVLQSLRSGATSMPSVSSLATSAAATTGTGMSMVTGSSDLNVASSVPVTPFPAVVYAPEKPVKPAPTWRGVGGVSLGTWAERGWENEATRTDIAKWAPSANGKVAVGILKDLESATPAQLASREWRQTLNDINRDVFGDPTLPDVIPVDPPKPAPAAAAPAAAPPPHPPPRPPPPPPRAGAPRRPRQAPHRHHPDGHPGAGNPGDAAGPRRHPHRRIARDHDHAGALTHPAPSRTRNA